MLRCEHCGALLRQDWDYCSRCGADLPPDYLTDDDEDGGIRRGMRSVLQSARSSIGSARLAYPSGGSSPSGGPSAGTSDVTAPAEPNAWKSRLRSLGSTRGPSGAVLLGIVAVVLAAALAVTWWSALDARDQLDGARVQQAQAEAETARVSEELQATQEQAAALQAELDQAHAALEDLQLELTGGEEQLGTLSGEIVALREQLSAVQADLDEAVAVIDERDATVADQAAAISVLSDCMSGMQVALAFARSGQIDSADRAFMTVSDSCERARSLL